MTLSVTALTHRPRGVPALLDRGEQIIHTYRGRDIARLTPAAEEAEPTRRFVRD